MEFLKRIHVYASDTNGVIKRLIPWLDLLNYRGAAL